MPKHGNTNVLIHYPVVTALDAASERCCGIDEDGGIFLGSYRGPHIEILNITRSGPADKRDRYSFIRQDASHQRLATLAWKKSRETVTFVGEWHTHPSGRPIPSSIDAGSWATLVKRSREPMVFVVVAPKAWSAYIVGTNGDHRHAIALTKSQPGELGVVFCKPSI